MKITWSLFGLCLLLIRCSPPPAAPQALDMEKEIAAIRAVIAKKTESHYKQVEACPILIKIDSSQTPWNVKQA